MNRNKHNNRASPHRPKISAEIPHLPKSQARLPHSEMKKAAWWPFGNHSGMRGTGRGTRKDGGIWDWHREISLWRIRSSVPKGQVCTGRRFPQKPLSWPHQLTCELLSIQLLLPCQMRDDLDVDKIFVLSWLWGQILSLFPIIIQRCKSQQHPEWVQNQYSERSPLLGLAFPLWSSEKLQLG